MAINGWATVSYGGVVFEMRSTKGIKREAVYNDNKTYLYTKWTFDFTSVYNPEATSYGPNTNPNRNADSTPPTVPGLPATITDASLRHYLSQPRRTLIYAFGPNILLRTPSANYSCDAENGPTVEICDVLESYGVRTFLVHLRITAVVNECGAKIPLLSHTWKASVDYDKDYYATRTIEGTAVFRSDALQKLSTWPDQYRQDLMFPVPPNMRRESIKIVAEEDGVTYHYQVVDHEQGCNIQPVDGGPVRFEGFFTAGYDQTGLNEAALDLDIANTQAIAQTAQNIITSTAGSGAIAAAVGLEFSRFANSVAAGSSRIPKLYQHCQVRAWGNSYSNRFIMIKWCMAVVLSKMSSVRVGGEEVLDPYRSNSLRVTEQLNGQYVEVDLTQRWPSQSKAFTPEVRFPDWVGGFGFNAEGVVDVHQGLRITLASFDNNGEIDHGFGDVNTVRAVVSRRPTISNPAIFAGRGNFWADLLAQALSAPCALPEQVPANYNRQRVLAFGRQPPPNLIPNNAHIAPSLYPPRT